MRGLPPAGSVALGGAFQRALCSFLCLLPCDRDSRRPREAWWDLCGSLLRSKPPSQLPSEASSRSTLLPTLSPPENP